MDLLLLLTFSLLFAWIEVDAQRTFTIRSVNLAFEPSSNVTRGTNVTMRCTATVSKRANESLSLEYTVYKDNERVYAKTSLTWEGLRYRLPEARVSNTGKYMCAVRIEGKEVESEAKKLRVTGLSKPVLHLNSSVVTEGEEVVARCEAPGETGSMFFYFYQGSRVIVEKKGSLNRLEVKLPLGSVGTHTVRCSYMVLVFSETFRSEDSDAADVTVRELRVRPVLEFYPGSDIFEGDRLYVVCRNQPPTSTNVNLYLSQGTQLLSTGATEVGYNVTALSDHSGDFECRLEMGSIEKVTSRRLLVTELFSEPKLTVSLAEVFQKDPLTLTCKSERFASQRLASRELLYRLNPPQSHFTQTSPGVFSGRALLHEFNYSCAAEARGIVKDSEALTVRPKVSVSAPEISVVGLAVVGRPFEILCRSAVGSLPINYTLLNNGSQVKTLVVRRPSQKATFQVSVSSPDEMDNYMCRARNRHTDTQHSRRLNATVIVPLTKPVLLVHPELAETYEGNELLLICRITGTTPVTFKWFRNGNNLKTSTSDHFSMDYHVQRLHKDDGGDYHCEAFNEANGVHSDTITIEVYMATWKRVLIGGVSVLVLLVLVLVCVLYFRSKRGDREAAAELSVKPSSPKSDDSLTETLTPDTEASNGAKVGSGRAAVSVWTQRPPDAASDEVSSVVSNEPDVEYTEVVHPQPLDPARVTFPLRKGTDTVYSELKDSPHGADEHQDCGSLEFAEPDAEHADISHYSPEVHRYQDLPEPVD